MKFKRAVRKDSPFPRTGGGVAVMPGRASPLRRIGRRRRPTGSADGNSRRTCKAVMNFIRFTPSRRPRRVQKNSHFLNIFHNISSAQTEIMTQFHKNVTLSHTTKFPLAINCTVARFLLSRRGRRRGLTLRGAFVRRFRFPPRLRLTSCAGRG